MNAHSLAIACFVAAACGGAPAGPLVPPSLVIPVPPAPHEPAAKGATAGERTRFGPIRDRVLDEILADDPGRARELGLHEYDGKVAPVSKDALAARVARLRKAQGDLASIDAKALSDDEALDLALLKSAVESALFWEVDVDAHHKRAGAYEDMFAVNLYVDREYAPIEERAKRLTDQEEAALVQVPHARENLAPPLSKPMTEVAAKNIAGYAAYLRGDVAKVMGKVGDEAQRTRFAKANGALAKAADDLAAWLRKEAARGDQSHVLGGERFAKLLRVQEGLAVPLADFERMNEEDLAANRSAYEALAARVKPKPVKEADYFATAARMTRDARKFLVDRGIVTLATSDDATVRETPPYSRWNAASLEASGPFETARVAFYQLTLPDRAWPKKEREAYLGTMGDLLGTTIHEVYPGHFVQERWQERAPTRAQKALWDYAFVEGWAHYAERMMIEEGFGTDDPENELAMRHGALLRNCRYAAAIAIHTRGSTVEQAAKRFETDCHQDVATAREQAVRGTFDPGYFAYTLGKLQILALREEAKKKLGDRFSLHAFHDALLSHGAPPMALLHDRVLRDLSAR